MVFDTATLNLCHVYFGTGFFISYIIEIYPSTFFINLIGFDAADGLFNSIA